MFLENHTKNPPRGGWIEVICGSMFSGKTEELIRRLRRALIAGQIVEIFKPRIDDRYDKEDIVSHDSNSIKSTPVDKASDILNLVDKVDVVGIDEAQFFGTDLGDVCQALANKGLRIVVAGLDMDFQARPFGPLPMLMAQAEYVTKVHAICVQCGHLANFSHRMTQEKDLVVLGETRNYEPLCRTCYFNALEAEEAMSK